MAQFGARVVDQIMGDTVMFMVGGTAGGKVISRVADAKFIGKMIGKGRSLGKQWVSVGSIELVLVPSIVQQESIAVDGDVSFVELLAFNYLRRLVDMVGANEVQLAG